MSYPINTTVRKIGQIAIEGNIIPNEWYYHLKNEKGKIQTNAALILADIIYWYRPVPIYNIKNGELSGYGKKFKDDLLQLGYKYFNNKFGFTEVQSRNALIFLENKGLIFREFRDITVGHYILNNVMYIGIYPDKIAAITNKSGDYPISSINETIEQNSLLTEESQKQSPPKLIPTQIKPKQKDWAAKFTDEQKAFLNYLLNIKPEVGDLIERDHATWWIKSYGIEKVKIALQVYWQRVEMAKKDPTVPMPQHIGKYIRKALNDGLVPSVSNEASAHQESILPPCSQKSNQGVTKIELESHKNETTNTQISMTSMFVNEVNDKGESLTFQKEIEIANKDESEKNKEAKQTAKSIAFNYQAPSQKKNSQTDWKAFFKEEEKNYLAFLLRIVPEKGDPIEEKHATWWIKHFGIDKIKIALQVYWQQVEKAKKDSKVSMPMSIGAYVREALNKGTQPCRENNHRNKAFAEQFKNQVGWSTLTITQKYCRLEDLGKELSYNLPEENFQDFLRSMFENYCSLTERQSCVA